MSRSGNALWIGAIIIVAALTTVELMSSRDKGEAVESAESSMDTIASGTPVQSQTNQMTSDRAATSDHDDDFADVIDPVTDFDPTAFQAPGLIVDLDNPEAYTDTAPDNDGIHQKTEAQQHITETTATKVPTEPETIAETGAALQFPETHSPLVSIDVAEDSAIGLPTAEKPIVEQAITQHLANAERAIKELRLTTPVGNNAYEHYQAILAQAPNNTDAQAGIQKIVDMYIYFVEKAIADNKAQTAKAYLQRAERLQPGSEKLKQLRAALY